MTLVILASVLAGLGLGYVLFAPAKTHILKISASTLKNNAIDLSLDNNGIYRVRSVIDGDTIVLENGLHLRYNGINTPESGRWFKDYAPMAKEATAKNIELVEGKRVRLQLGPNPIDMHGRIVASVYVIPDEIGQPEIEVREVLLKGGFAKLFPLGISAEENKVLKVWQEEAKAAEAGIWGLKKNAEKNQTPKPFCASSSSKTFHHASCSQARRISPANLIEYDSTQEAETAGLKLCAQCQKKQ